MEGSPVGVEDGGSVASKEGYLIGKLPAFIQRYDGECATTAGLPIDR